MKDTQQSKVHLESGHYIYHSGRKDKHFLKGYSIQGLTETF